jgi:hypothetical protein
MVAFDPAFYLYLNPGITAGNNTADDLLEYYVAHSNETLYADPCMLPKNFNVKTYLEDHKAVADVSGLGKVIAATEELCCDSEDIGEYVRNLNLPVRLVSKNLFEVTEKDRTRLTVKSLGVGDNIRLKKSAVTAAYAMATWIDYAAGLVRVSNTKFDFTDLNTCYIFDGIRVPDARRIATINYLAGRVWNDTSLISATDPMFNVELYKMLYPDSRNLTCMGAYLDLVSHKERGYPRIGKVADLSTTKGLTIDEPITLFGSRIEAVRTSFDSFSTGSSSALAKSTLVTEKTLTDAFSNVAIFHQPLKFDGAVSFSAQSVFGRFAAFPEGLGTVAIGIGWGLRPPTTQNWGLQLSNVCAVSEMLHESYDPFQCSGNIPFPNIPRVSGTGGEGMVSNLLGVTEDVRIYGTCLLEGLVIVGPKVISHGSCMDVNGGINVRGETRTASLHADVVDAKRLTSVDASFAGDLTLDGKMTVFGESTFVGNASFPTGVSLSRIGIGPGPISAQPVCNGILERFMTLGLPCTAKRVSDLFPGMNVMDVLVGVLAEVCMR